MISEEQQRAIDDLFRADVQLGVARREMERAMRAVYKAFVKEKPEKSEVSNG